MRSHKNSGLCLCILDCHREWTQQGPQAQSISDTPSNYTKQQSL